MHKETIKEKVFRTSAVIIYDCSEEELAKYIDKAYNYSIKITFSIGKTVVIEDGKYTDVIIWINSPKNMVTLSHEILHLVTFWLNRYYKIPLNDDTEEVYTMLHSFYMREAIKKLK